MRSPISPSLSLARSRSRRSSSGIGAVMKIVTAPGTSSFTFSAPSVSSSSTGVRSRPAIRSTSDRSVPYRLPDTYVTCSRKSPSCTRRTNSASERNQYSRPSSSPWRRRRVVAEIATSSSGTRSSRALMSVPLPAPEGPVITKTGEPSAVPVEEPNQLGALAVGQPADGLRLADAALVEEAGGLHAPELRHCHQHVEHLRRADVLRRVVEDLLDLDLP